MEASVSIVAMQVATQPFVASQHVDKKVRFVLLPYFKKVANIDNVYAYVEVLKVDFRNSFVLEEATIDQMEVASESDNASG